MAITLKNGAVFLHIPKTGGNWVTTMLHELGLVAEVVSYKHADLDRFFAPKVPQKGRKALLKYTFKQLFEPKSGPQPFMFCFVRNPLAWYESWFKYMDKHRYRWRHWGDAHDVNKWHPNSILNGLGQCDFPQFVQNVNSKRPGYVTELYGWYTKPQMDFVGKQEQLVDDFIKVLTIMDVKFDEDFIRGYGKVGVSPEPDNTLTWPEPLRLETALLEYAGLVRYGYQQTLNDLGLNLDRLQSHQKL